MDQKIGTIQVPTEILRQLFQSKLEQLENVIGSVIDTFKSDRAAYDQRISEISDKINEISQLLSADFESRQAFYDLLCIVRPRVVTDDESQRLWFSERQYNRLAGRIQQLLQGLNYFTDKDFHSPGYMCIKIYYPEKPHPPKEIIGNMVELKKALATLVDGSLVELTLEEAASLEIDPSQYPPIVFKNVFSNSVT